MSFIVILNIIAVSDEYIYTKQTPFQNTANAKFKMIKSLLNIGKKKSSDYDTILNDLCNAQKVFHTLTKFMRIKKAKKNDVDHDLLYNELSTFKEYLKIDIYHEKSVYTFTLRELHKLWKISLIYNEFMIPKPAKLKNPYNNIVINDNVLYNIYFDMLFKGLNIDPLIHHYFKVNFNVNMFLNNNYSLLYELALNDYTDEIIETNHNMYRFISVIKHKYPTITNNIYINLNLPQSIKTTCVHKFKKAIKYYCMFCFAYDIDILNSKIGIYENKCMKEVMKINEQIFCRPYLQPERINGKRKNALLSYFQDDHSTY